MTIRIAAATAAILLGLAAPATSAFAFEGFAPRFERPFAVEDRDDLTTGSIGAPTRAPLRESCVPSPAAEGNANMQARAVKNYGGTSGGYACY